MTVTFGSLKLKITEYDRLKNKLNLAIEFIASVFNKQSLTVIRQMLPKASLFYRLVQIFEEIYSIVVCRSERNVDKA